MSPHRFPEPAPFSRRRLLQLGGLLATAIPAATVLAGQRGAAAAADKHQTYQDTFRTAVAEDRNIREYGQRGREFWYRPGQLLVAADDTDRVSTWLRRAGVPFDLTDGFAGMTRLVLDPEADIPSIVARLRNPRQWRGRPAPAVQPHHVIVGYDNVMGNPGSPPVPAAAAAPPDAQRRGDGEGVLVGICDTGIWRDAGAFHPLWLHGAYSPEPDDEDSLYLYDDVLALEAGHGTFVAGVLRQAAPGVTFDPEPALNPAGIGDEEMLVAAIDRLDRRASIISLSLGCYTQGDVAPLPIVHRLAELGRDVVVVAAAGNAGGSRPTWPAALPTVLAVAAVSLADGTAAPAAYSNFGPWVNACAEGTRTSTYVTGRMGPDGPGAADFAGFAQWSGTSFATPHVAGTLAAMMTASESSAAQAAQDLLAGPVWQNGFGVLVK